jgi:hypothetical protein
MQYLQDLPSIIIASGSSGSSLVPVADDVYGIGIQAPATVTASQLTVWVSVSSAPTSTFAQLLSGGTAIVVGAAQAITIAPFTFKQIMIQSTAAGGEGGERTIGLTKTVNV